MKHYRYSVIDADLKYHITKHPQLQMKDLGFNIIDSEPYPIGDCWIFRVANEPSNIPEYIQKVSDDFKFSWEEQRPYHIVDDIRDFNLEQIFYTLTMDKI